MRQDLHPPLPSAQMGEAKNHHAEGEQSWFLPEAHLVHVCSLGSEAGSVQQLPGDPGSW